MSDETKSKKRLKRRYSSLLINSDGDVNFESILEKLDGKFKKTCTIDSTDLSIKILEYEYYSNKCYYPSDPITPSDSHAELYSHHVFVAEITLPNEKKYILVCSPYVRMLTEMMVAIYESINSQSKGESARYPCVRPLISKVSEKLKVSGEYDTSKITVANELENTLDFVTLSGRSPLKSELLDYIKDSCTPYSVQVVVNFIDGSEKRSRLGLNIDAHGNIWWFMRDERVMENICIFLKYLGINNMYKKLPVGKLPSSRDTEFDDI